MENPETHTSFVMSESETPQENYKNATEALENIANMAQEMEDRYEERVQILRLQFEDACTQAEKYLLENQELKKKLEADRTLEGVKDAMSDVLEEENEELTETLNALYNKAEKLENTVNELQTENDDLTNQLGYIIAEEREARRSFTAFQIAVSLLIFVYGMMYGTYFKTC